MGMCVRQRREDEETEEARGGRGGRRRGEIEAEDTLQNRLL